MNPKVACRQIASASPTYGGLLVSIWHRIAPSANTSARRPIRWLWPCACSGGMYANVPSTLPVRVSMRVESVTASTLGFAAASAGCGSASSSRDRASPQSITCTSPKLPTITLLGFRSR